MLLDCKIMYIILIIENITGIHHLKKNLHKSMAEQFASNRKVSRLYSRDDRFLSGLGTGIPDLGFYRDNSYILRATDGSHDLFFPIFAFCDSTVLLPCDTMCVY